MSNWQDYFCRGLRRTETCVNEQWPWSKHAGVCVDASVCRESEPNVAVCGVVPPECCQTPCVRNGGRDFQDWLVADW